MNQPHLQVSQIRSRVTAAGADFTRDIEKLNALVREIQNSVGAVSPEDQKTIDALETLADNLTRKAEGFLQIGETPPDDQPQAGQPGAAALTPHTDPAAPDRGSLTPDERGTGPRSTSARHTEDARASTSADADPAKDAPVAASKVAHPAGSRAAIGAIGSNLTGRGSHAKR